MLKEVIIIPPTIDNKIYGNEFKILRVASYSRVSTDFEDQLTSFHAQKTYYTDLILKTKGWKLAGTYADEGISGANAKNRPEFQKMIRHCKRGKIDLIITKSISRFARNTIDSIEYVRTLKSMGIGVLFEKENINTLEENSEIILTILAALAQEELISLSTNVKMGIRMAMKEGRVNFRYHNAYGYEKGANGMPEIVPKEAEVVKQIYRWYLSGKSTNVIADLLNEENILKPSKKGNWDSTAVRRILKHERYVGDLILQKTFIQDPITKKVVQNIGQLPKYKIMNNHTPIVSRHEYDKVQEELVKRGNKKKAAKNSKCISGKHSRNALTGMIFCSDCGSQYRRLIWRRKRKGVEVRVPVWRCTNRVDVGVKFCDDSVTVDEESLQKAIMEAISISSDDRKRLIPELLSQVENVLWEEAGGLINVEEVEKEIELLKEKTMQIVAESIRTNTVTENQTVLKEMSDKVKMLSDKVTEFKMNQDNKENIEKRMMQIKDTIENDDIDYSTYNNDLIRQIVSAISIIDEHKIKIYFKNGYIQEQEIRLQIKPAKKLKRKKEIAKVA